MTIALMTIARMTIAPMTHILLRYQFRESERKASSA
jgi:hypothetical protein